MKLEFYNWIENIYSKHELGQIKFGHKYDVWIRDYSDGLGGAGAVELMMTYDDNRFSFIKRYKINAIGREDTFSLQDAITDEGVVFFFDEKREALELFINEVVKRHLNEN